MVKVTKAIMVGKIIPLVCEIFFPIKTNLSVIQIALQDFNIYEVKVTAQESDAKFSVLDGLIFYEITLTR